MRVPGPKNRAESAICHSGNAPVTQSRETVRNQDFQEDKMNTRGSQIQIDSTPSKLTGTVQLENVRFLNRRERKLVELALEIGGRRQGRTIDGVRHLIQDGFAPTELLEVGLLAVTKMDCPQALTWVNDGLATSTDPHST
jgi:hypothetical protein